MVTKSKQGATPVKDKPEVQRVAYSVDEFCAAHRVTKPTFYALLKEGKAPRIMRVRRRVLITEESAAEWRRDRTAETYQGVAA
jgi:hypothetical protein